jgi:hypothetical protein
MGMNGPTVFFEPKMGYDQKQAILIVTWAGTVKYCQRLLESLKGYKNYPIIVAINEIESCHDEEFLEYVKDYDVLKIEGNRWELGGLTAAICYTSYDEFILIQDTLEVKDPSIFDMMFRHNGSIAFGKDWQCYLGKYRRQVLNSITIPICLTKMDAFYQEVMFASMYTFVANQVEGIVVPTLFPEWGNDNPNNWQDHEFDRDNIVLDNPYLIKRKSVTLVPHETGGTTWKVSGR